MKLAIKPVSIDLQTADMIDVQVNALRLNDSAEIHVDFLKDNGTVTIDNVPMPDMERIAQKQFVLTGVDYQAWNDDAYVIDYVLTKYGLAKA